MSFLKKNYLFIVVLITFLGFYASILLFANYSGLESSRRISMPLRLFNSLILILIFLNNPLRLKFSKESWWFLAFIIIYSIRIFFDYILNASYYLSYNELVLYFISFCIFPFIVISNIRIDLNKINQILKGIVYGGIAFSLLSITYYGKFIGQVSRLNSDSANESILSPLALSYCSSLVIGVFSFYLMHNKTTIIIKTILMPIVVLSFVPFFLGASRGSLLALIVSFLIYFFLSNNLKLIVRNVLIITIAITIIMFFDSYFKSGLLDRFLSTSEDIETGSSGASRINIWKRAFNQFLENPIFGDGLKVDKLDGYAHNLFIEVLQTTGIIGFIPIVILMILVWKRVFFIGKNHKEYFWVLVIFIQSFVQQMFSGAIYTASWMWTSMALIFILYNYITSNKKYK